MLSNDLHIGLGAWLFRGFLATGYIARYIWLYSHELYSQIYLAILPDISGYIASQLYSQIYLAI